MKNKGMTVTIATIIASGTILTSVLFSYFGGQMATINRTADIEGDVKVLQNEDVNINKRFDTLEDNLSDRFDYLEELIKASK